jgi:hypothetical protein
VADSPQSRKSERSISFPSGCLGSFCWRFWFGREFFEALAFGLWEQRDGGDEAEEADDCGSGFGGHEAVPAHEEGEGEDAEEASEFAHGGGDAVAGGADADGEDFRGVDEGRRIRSEFGEEKADAVDDDEGDHLLFDIGDKRDDTECQGHHAEAEGLDGFAAELIHGEDGNDVAGRGEDGEDHELSEGFPEQAVVRAEGGEDERAGYGVAVVGEVHEEPREAYADEAAEELVVVGEAMEAIPERDGMLLLVEVLGAGELALLVFFLAGGVEEARRFF